MAGDSGQPGRGSVVHDRPVRTPAWTTDPGVRGAHPEREPWCRGSPTVGGFPVPLNVCRYAYITLWLHGFASQLPFVPTRPHGGFAWLVEGTDLAALLVLLAACSDDISSPAGQEFPTKLYPYEVTYDAATYRQRRITSFSASVRESHPPDDEQRLLAQRRCELRTSVRRPCSTTSPGSMNPMPLP